MISLAKLAEELGDASGGDFSFQVQPVHPILALMRRKPLCGPFEQFSWRLPYGENPGDWKKIERGYTITDDRNDGFGAYPPPFRIPGAVRLEEFAQ